MKFQHSSQNTQLNPQIADFNATEVNGTLFFTVDRGKNGRQLWKTDGTSAGTIFVKNI
jgi:hypothetical protein